MDDNEEFYDNEIAPVLLKLMERCSERRMSFVAQVEYQHGDYGLTAKLSDDHSLAMAMLYLCAKSKNNIDSYIINLLRHLQKENIQFDHSIILSRYMKGDALS